MPLRQSSPRPTRLALAMLCALTACTRQPVPAPPPLQIDALASVPIGTSRQALPEDWWRLFNDPQLDRWVQRALARNQDLAQAKANVQAMLAGIAEFDAQRWPATALGLAATYGKTADDQTLAKATDSHASAQWQLNPGIELAYQVDIWGQVRAAIERAAVQADASAAALDLVHLNVVTQTSRAYVQHCTYSARLKQTRQSLHSLEHSVQLSQRQQQAGIATELDRERLLALREQLRAELPLLEAHRQMALYELNMLSGQAAPAAAITCDSPPALAAALPLGDGWQLLERRPDVRQAERELRAAGLDVEIVTADLYPKVSFGASLTAADQHLGHLGDSRAVMFGIGPLITWQFPNVRANRARVRKAEALQQAQRAHYQGVALAALKDVRQALARFDGERQSLLAVTAALEHGQRAHALADFSYRAGALDGLALLDSERELIGLRARQVDAQGRLAQAQINLLRALGGRWQASISKTGTQP
ncbi:TolC family protein [Pseudomonas putida]|uniref:efflux transporter outer membrane subunit n=1 Tax=Pseudomonas putida TaxID=303 RepID=UPI001A8D8566|nr:TolC family protein [Pseudomonas putida]MBO0368088.1 TolC family protein [Pseudomonas putida]